MKETLNIGDLVWLCLHGTVIESARGVVIETLIKKIREKYYIVYWFDVGYILEEKREDLLKISQTMEE